MKTRIKLHTVRQSLKNGHTLVAGGVVVTLDDGHEIHFDITTLTNGKPVMAKKAMQVDGKVFTEHADPKHAVVMAAISAFIHFVELTRCMTFSSNRFDDSDRFLRNLSINPSNLFASLTDFECLVDSQFIALADKQYYAMPLDMSQDWQPFEPNSNQLARIEAVTASIKRTLRYQSEQATRQYRKTASGGYRHKQFAGAF